MRYPTIRKVNRITSVFTYYTGFYKLITVGIKYRFVMMCNWEATVKFSVRKGRYKGRYMFGLQAAARITVPLDTVSDSCEENY